MIDGVQSFSEEDYIRQLPDLRRREYALNYTENASFITKQVMIKDVATATAQHQPVIVESNFFVDASVRALYREKCLTRTHMPIYVSVYIPENIREQNKVLDKYTDADNQMFIGLNKRPRKGEGFVVMSVREVIEYLKERNGTK